MSDVKRHEAVLMDTGDARIDPVEVVLASAHEREVAALRAALESIAANTCCDRCQEAALVARTALNQGEQRDK